MFDLNAYVQGLLCIAGLGLIGWGVSTARHNVTLVDSLWSLFFALGLTAYIQAWVKTGMTLTERAGLLALLVGLWASRLSLYLAVRNRLFSGEAHEDRRYAAIRRNNEPHFWLKSLYIIFGLQAVLAWIVSLPLLGAVHSTVSLNWIDAAACALWLLGFGWESVADRQLTHFKADPDNQGKVLQHGLWRYSRHPNYFGECCLWWGYYGFALAAGAWWALPGPVLMTVLLLKVSGVTLLEKDIGLRRPAYAEYIQRTSAFLPWPPRKKSMP